MQFIVKDLNSSDSHSKIITGDDYELSKQTTVRDWSSTAPLTFSCVTSSQIHTVQRVWEMFSCQ